MTKEEMKKIYRDAGYSNGEVLALVNRRDRLFYSFVTAVVTSVDAEGRPSGTEIVVLSSLEKAETAWEESHAACILAGCRK